MTTGPDSGAAWSFPFFLLDGLTGAGGIEAPSSAAAMTAGDATAAVGGVGTATVDNTVAGTGGTAGAAKAEFGAA